MRFLTISALAAAVVLSLVGGTSAQQRQGGQTKTMPNMDQSQMQGMDMNAMMARWSQMQGMDMNAMMARCTQMRQQMRPGMAMPADMQKTMAQCDQMDRSMGMPPPRR